MTQRKGEKSISIIHVYGRRAATFPCTNGTEAVKGGADLLIS